MNDIVELYESYLSRKEVKMSEIEDAIKKMLERAKITYSDFEEADDGVYFTFVSAGDDGENLSSLVLYEILSRSENGLFPGRVKVTGIIDRR